MEITSTAPESKGRLPRENPRKAEAKLANSRQPNRVRVKDILSEIPVDFEKVRKEDLDKEILRAGIISELDAINFYEQLASTTRNKNIREVLLDLAREEKTHVGELQALLLKEDKEQKEEMERGREEVYDMIE